MARRLRLVCREHSIDAMSIFETGQKSRQGRLVFWVAALVSPPSPAVLVEGWTPPELQGDIDEMTERLRAKVTRGDMVGSKPDDN